MTEHAPEIVTLLAWVIVAGGGLFLALAKWIAAQLMRKLEGIEQAIKETNRTLGTIEGDLRGELTMLERRHEERLVKVERRVDSIRERCHIFHDHDKD